MTQTSETSETVDELIKGNAPIELNHTAEELIELIQRSDVGLIPTALFSDATCIAISPSYEGMQLVQFRNNKVKNIDLAECDERQRHIVNYTLQSSVVPSEELITAIYEMDSNPPYDLAEFKLYVQRVVDLVSCIFTLYKPSTDPDLRDVQQKIYDIYSPYGLEVLVGYVILNSLSTSIQRDNVRSTSVARTLITQVEPMFKNINAEIANINETAITLWNKYLQVVEFKKTAIRVELIALQEVQQLKTVEQQQIAQLYETNSKMRAKNVLADSVVQNAKNMQVFLANNSFAASGVTDGHFWGITGWNVVELHNYVGRSSFSRNNPKYQLLTKYRLLPPVVVIVKDILTTKALDRRWGLAVLEAHKQYFQSISYDGTTWFNKCIPHQSSGRVNGLMYNQGKLHLSSYGQQSCIVKGTDILNDLFDVSQGHCVTDYKFLNMFRTLPQYANAVDGYGESALALIPISQRYVDIIRGPKGQDIFHNFITDEERIEDSFNLICEANSVDTFGFTANYSLSSYSKSVVIPERLRNLPRQ